MLKKTLLSKIESTYPSRVIEKIIRNGGSLAKLKEALSINNLSCKSLLAQKCKISIQKKQEEKNVARESATGITKEVSK